MAQSQNTIQELILGNAIATETELDAFTATASAGEIGIFSQKGSAVEYGPFVIAQKTVDSVLLSDVIFPDKIYSLRSSEDSPAVQKVVTVTIPTLGAVGTDYILDINIREHGSLSVRDYYIKHGAYRSVTGNDQEDIVDGLIASLNRNFSREPNATATSNPYFTFAKSGTGATAALTITAKAQPFVVGKRFGKPTMFDVVARFDPGVGVVTVTTPGFIGNGTGPQVAQLEYDLRKNRGDLYGPIGYPNNFASTARANPAGTYNMIDIVHYRGHDGWNDVAMRKVTTIAINESGTTGLNALLASISTARVNPALVGPEGPAAG